MKILDRISVRKRKYDCFSWTHTLGHTHIVISCFWHTPLVNSLVYGSPCLHVPSQHPWAPHGKWYPAPFHFYFCAAHLLCSVFLPQYLLLLTCHMCCGLLSIIFLTLLEINSTRTGILFSSWHMPSTQNGAWHKASI